MRRDAKYAEINSKKHIKLFKLFRKNFSNILLYLL